MPLTMQTRPAAYAVIVQEGKILLSRWVAHIPGYQPGWTLPGGGMEPGEQPAQTVLREVFEETGYAIELDGLLGVHAGYFEPDPGSDLPFCALRTVYLAHVVGGDLTYELGGSTDRAEWIALDELDQYFYYSLVDEAARMMGHKDAAAWAVAVREGRNDDAV